MASDNKKLETEADKALQEMCESADPYRQYTLQEIAVVMGITRERVRQIEAAALRKVRRRLWSLLKQDGLSEEELKR